jgi:hypothetical protein
MTDDWDLLPARDNHARLLKEQNVACAYYYRSSIDCSQMQQLARK